MCLCTWFKSNCTYCILRIAQKQILLLPLWNIGLTWESRLALLESLKVLNECSCLRNKHIPKWQGGFYSSSQLKSIDSSIHFGKYFCISHLFEYCHVTKYMVLQKCLENNQKLFVLTIYRISLYSFPSWIVTSLKLSPQQNLSLYSKKLNYGSNNLN